MTDKLTTDKTTSYHRIVVKIGSSTLTDASGRVDSAFIQSLATQIHQLTSELGAQVLIVTSGAITAGLEALGFGLARPADLPTLQAAAAVGQLRLAQQYVQACAAWDLSLGQILLTRYDTEHRQSYLHARDTLERLLELGVIPLINENDTVAVDEIRFGDNDTLAAQVAILVKADLMVILSDIDGLYTADPRRDEDATLLAAIGSFTQEILAAAGSAGTLKGSGGMVTKLEAARLCMAAGIPMVICEGHQPDVLMAVARNQSLGTRFAAEVTHSHSARKLWQALAGQIQGALYIDAGAERALRERGSSLLPVGIRRVEGDFGAGAVVDIRNLEGLTIGRGLANYAAATLAQAAGHNSQELIDAATAGHTKPLTSGPSAAQVAIHRDQLVVFY